ncbi:MAG: PKD repeat protein, partial [Saprospiraceae bacterium]
MNRFTILISFLIIFNTINIFSQNCDANFSFTMLDCNVITFQPNIINVNYTYTWDFGDPPNTSNGPMPTHTYPMVTGSSSTDYIVILTVNGPDCNEFSTQQTITIFEFPTASISHENATSAFGPWVACGPTVDNPNYTLEINNESTGNITSYMVDWGDGSTPYTDSTLPNGTFHLYQVVGTFDIVITVTNANGCSDARTYMFFSGNNPSVGLSILGNTVACLPESFTFNINDVEDNPEGTIYIINVNDGSPSVMFNHPPPPSFIHTFLMSSCDTAFMDQNEQFAVEIIAVNPCDTSKAVVSPIRIFKGPEADFEIAPDSIQCVNDEFTFTNTSNSGSYYLGGMIGQCLDTMVSHWTIVPNTGWSITSFSSGTSYEDAETFSATFNQPGTYDITLEVANWEESSCDPDFITKTICVIPIPAANFDFTQSSGCPISIVELENLSNTLNSCDETIYEWEIEFMGSDCGENGSWEFINSTNENSLEPDLQFDSSGVYSIRLTVMNDCGIDTYLDSVIIGTSPVLEIFPIDNFCISGSIEPELDIFSDCYSDTPPMITWNFPEGSPTSASGISPGEISYSSAGTYTITASTENDCGAAVATQTFTIYPPPALPNITSNTPICSGEDLCFTTQNGVNITYSWEGPNMWTSIEEDPCIFEATPINSGTYFLTVTDLNTSCENTVSIDVTVHPLP